MEHYNDSDEQEAADKDLIRILRTKYYNAIGKQHLLMKGPGDMSSFEESDSVEQPEKFKAEAQPISRASSVSQSNRRAINRMLTHRFTSKTGILINDRRLRCLRNFKMFYILMNSPTRYVIDLI